MYRILTPYYSQNLTKQASQLSHSSNLYYNEWATKLAELLVTLTQRDGGLGWAAGALPPLGISSDDTQYAPAGGAKVFFANSGTEANEGAIKVARKVGKERTKSKGREIRAPETSDAPRRRPELPEAGCLAQGGLGSFGKSR